ncbi:peptide deformylase [Corynebacterium nuruki]|jgi:peptide deformylase|uniref:Peptide deformylase n=1 Tax=Corynebacterium nuruki TaxID=1032851 RepID=A0A3D4SXD3_9CORY|nr:peptide deformylase [Corynebacterium nuruki]HCT13929.1 peptide deformylase [Corynebacterium nuruki]
MSVLPIVICGEPVLHRPTEPVAEPVADQLGEGSDLSRLIADMYETLDLANGVGLAANQVGVGLRVFVYHCPDVDGPDGTRKSEADIEADGGPMRKGCVINPVLETGDIPETMPDPDDDVEGCLSVPGYDYPTGRADWARVTGYDEHGEPVSVEGYGFFARCLQHETGHLDGHLYIDTLIGRYARQAKKMVKREGWTVPGNSWLPGSDADPFGHDE